MSKTQNLDKEWFQFNEKTFPEICDGIMIRMTFSGNVSERYGFIGGKLKFSA